MQERFKIAGIQMVCEVGAISANTQKALNLIHEAAQAGARIVCLPETFATGYELGRIQEKAPPLVSEVTAALQAAACRESVYVIAGLPYRSDQGMYNAAFMFSPTSPEVQVYRKMHLFSMSVLCEKNYFARGPMEIKTHPTAYGNLGLMICYDLRFPELARRLVLAGADLLIAISAWPLKRLKQFQILAASRAIENQCFLFAINRTGTDAGCEFGGHTTLFDPLGQPVAGSLQSLEEGIALVEVDLAMLCSARQTLPCFQDRHESYGL